MKVVVLALTLALVGEYDLCFCAGVTETANYLYLDVLK